SSHLSDVFSYSHSSSSHRLLCFNRRGSKIPVRSSLRLWLSQCRIPPWGWSLPPERIWIQQRRQWISCGSLHWNASQRIIVPVVINLFHNEHRLLTIILKILFGEVLS
ncbi:hypothetical protein PFISCL1PPCAC_1814, partial [Pristionchus fissidentatus]